MTKARVAEEAAEVERLRVREAAEVERLRVIAEQWEATHRYVALRDQRLAQGLRATPPPAVSKNAQKKARRAHVAAVCAASRAEAPPPETRERRAMREVAEAQVCERVAL